jgi:hypothetical protein
MYSSTTYTSVGAAAHPTNMHAPKYFPNTSSAPLTGLVSSVSIVPLRISSAISRIVTAGAIGSSIHPHRSKYARSDAGCPGVNAVSHTITPEMNKNSAVITHPAGVRKYDPSSRKQIVSILLMMRPPSASSHQPLAPSASRPTQPHA